MSWVFWILPYLQKNEKLVGIFTTTDVCRSFGQLLRALFPPKGSDHIA